MIYGSGRVLRSGVAHVSEVDDLPGDGWRPRMPCADRQMWCESRDASGGRSTDPYDVTQRIHWVELAAAFRGKIEVSTGPSCR